MVSLTVDEISLPPGALGSTCTELNTSFSFACPVAGLFQGSSGDELKGALWDGKASQEHVDGDRYEEESSD